MAVVKIRGKSYTTVDSRIKAFRKSHPISEGWGICTEVLDIDKDSVLILCRITDPDGRVVATAHAQEHRSDGNINRFSMVENGCTSATGRALAYCSFAGDGDFPICSADELQSALSHQDTEAQFADSLKPWGLTVQQVDAWAATIKQGPTHGWPTKWKINLLDRLTTSELNPETIRQAAKVAAEQAQGVHSV